MRPSGWRAPSPGATCVAICADHPFFSTDDWFIGTTPMGAGVPQAVSELTVMLPLQRSRESCEALFDAHPGQIAAVMLEPARHEDPRRAICSR